MKVLIISHNSMSTYENMGITMLTLFSGFNSKLICQLYTYEQLPDTDKASSYFKISDIDVISKTLHLENNSGEIQPDINVHSYGFNEKPKMLKFYQRKNNKNSIKVYLRDFLWSFGRWYDLNLECWLKNQAPDIIFVVPGRYKFIYNVAIKIAKDYSLPILTYICDDYYFTMKGKGLFSKYENRLLKNTIVKLLKNSKRIITINDDLKELYWHKFGIETMTLYTETKYEIKENRTINNPNRFVYMGNLNYNRDISLCEIGKVLDKINKKYKTNLQLKIYSMNPSSEILKRFNEVRSIHYMGYVTGKEFEKVFNDVHIFVHVEAFDNKSIESVRYSLSTKIPDILASGKLLFAYGSEELSSIRYLKKNKCAAVVTESDDLFSTIRTILFDYDNNCKIVDRAIKVALRNHMKGKSSTKLYDTICSIIK